MPKPILHRSPETPPPADVGSRTSKEIDLSKALRAFLGATALVSSLAAAAETYPSKPVRLVIPFPPGGGTDIIGRELATRLNARLGWTLVVDNRPGAGGNIGVDAVAKAPADGYTIVLGQTSNLAINPTLYPKLSYDPFKDLAPVSLVAVAPLAVVVSADSPYKTLADLVTAAKAKPGAINFASPGNGTVAHLTGELFQRAAGVKFTHVPYKGANQGLTDLVGGFVQLYMSSVPTVLPQIRAGKLRALAVTTTKRVTDLPGVPTVGEAGYAGFDASTWFGVLVRAGTSKDVVAKLNAEINRTLASPEVKKRIDDEGAEAIGSTPEKLAELMREEHARWRKVIADAGVKIE